MTLGENLQKLRKAKGLSQEEVAQALFVSRQTISKWETNKAEPGVDNLKALADLYGVTLDQLTNYTKQGFAPAEVEKTKPEGEYRTKVFLRLVVWIAAMAVAGLLGNGKGEALQVLAWSGTVGSVAVCLSLWVRNCYVWGGILCGETLCIFVALFCTLRPENWIAGIMSAGLTALLCVWLKYLSSEPVRKLFERE